MGILLILIGAAVGIGVWQKNNLEAVVQYTQYTQAELEQQIADNDKMVQDLLDEMLQAAETVELPEANELPINKPDTEPEVSDDNGEGETTEAAPSESTGPSTNPTPTPLPTSTPEQSSSQEESTSGYKAELQVLVDKVYALRSEYLKALDDLQAEAVAEYKSMSAEQRKGRALANFVSKYIGKATTLEKECDAKMDAIVEELRVLLKKYDQDLSLIDTVVYTYAQEKSLKKAWYMSELERRGFI